MRSLFWWGASGIAIGTAITVGSAFLVLALYRSGAISREQLNILAPALVFVTSMVGLAIILLGMRRVARRADAYWRSVDGEEPGAL